MVEVLVAMTVLGGAGLTKTALLKGLLIPVPKLLLTLHLVGVPRRTLQDEASS